MNTVERFKEHYKEALTLFPEHHIVGLFLQGSQNYGLETANSDVDTKLIVTPTFKEIAMNAKPVSTTHVRANDEHIDLKDIRLYIQTFYKQNLNFLEILFTPYQIINPLYKEQWYRLIAAREDIARMNPWRAVKSMKGIALEKYHAMEHPYPSKLQLIQEKGFDGKQVHHLLRVDDYLTRYIKGESYEQCLRPSPDKVAEMMAYKKQEVPLEEARKRAAAVLAHTEKIANEFCAWHEEKEDPAMRALLEDVCYEIMKISVQIELK